MGGYPGPGQDGGYPGPGAGMGGYPGSVAGALDLAGNPGFGTGFWTWWKTT